MEDESRLLGLLLDASFDREEATGRFRCVSMRDAGDIAVKLGLGRREVSAFALAHSILPLRYLKNIGTLGFDGQARLLASRILLVGAGGIGGNAAELLARMGAGMIVLVDPDTFDETNLNRQNFCCGASLELAKVDVVADRILEINDEVDVIRHRASATAANLPGLLEGVHAAIDALDSIDDRLVLQDACRLAGVVMVHGAIAGTSLQAATIYPGDPGLRGFAPPDGDGSGTRGIEDETGNPATTPALCAAIQVQEAIKVVLGSGETLRNRMLFLDTGNWEVDFIVL